MRSGGNSESDGGHLWAVKVILSARLSLPCESVRVHSPQLAAGSFAHLVLREGLAFAEELSLDLEEFLEVLKISPADSTVLNSKGRRMLQREFSPEARLLQHHKKDVGLDLKYAMPLGQELRLSRVHLDSLGQVMGAGDGKLNRYTGFREIRRRDRKPPSETA